MFNLEDSHQCFEKHDDHGTLISRWTMDKIKRNDSTVWVMNHFFVNPNSNLEEILEKEMTNGSIACSKIWLSYLAIRSNSD